MHWIVVSGCSAPASYSAQIAATCNATLLTDGFHNNRRRSLLRLLPARMLLQLLQQTRRRCCLDPPVVYLPVRPSVSGGMLATRAVSCWALIARALSRSIVHQGYFHAAPAPLRRNVQNLHRELNSARALVSCVRIWLLRTNQHTTPRHSLCARVANLIDYCNYLVSCN